MDGANDVVFESGERYIVLWNGLDDIRRIDSDLYGRRRDGDVFVFCGMKRHDRQGRERVGTGGEGDELDVVLDRRMHARVVGFFGNFVAHEPHRFEIGFEFVELVGDGGDAIRRRICRDGEIENESLPDASLRGRNLRFDLEVADVCDGIVCGHGLWRWNDFDKLWR